MLLHWLTGTSVLLFFCSLQLANGSAQKLQNNLEMLDAAGAINLGSLMAVIDRTPKTVAPEPLSLEPATLKPTILPPTTLTPINNSLINSCVQMERRAVALTRTGSTYSIVPAFITLEFPPSARVGEEFPVEITALNILSSSLPITVTLQQSPAYETLGSSVSLVCLPPNGQAKIVISMRPLQAGPAEISVRAAAASSPGCGPSVTARPFDIRSPIEIEFPGIPKEITFSKLLCSGDDFEEEDSLVEWRLEITDASVIPGTVKARITVTGNLLAPTLDNIGDLIKMPYGCGEQNMITLTPNIYVLQYLTETNQLTNDIEERLLENMNAGYQRELDYKLSDGSYSAFGSRDSSGSTWLTAFVVKSFAQAKKFIAVNSNEITTSSNWLKSLQRPDGCFQNVGRVIHKEMQGGNDGAPGALAAFVMIALLEAGEPPSSSVITSGQACIDAATAFGTPGANDKYLLALKAYAYSLAGFPGAPAAVGILFTGLTFNSDGSVYWIMRNSVGGINAALSVETTSYGLLAILTQYGHNLHHMSIQIVKWLSSKMNSHGGFVSTQDTVLALQALAKFESLHPQVALGVTVKVVGKDLDVTYVITEENNLQTQNTEVDVIPNDIKAKVEGNGCALVQAVVSYSVENPQKIFGLTLSVRPKNSRALDCRFKTISACVAYTLQDKRSNMAIIELTLVTGYTPVQSDLESLVCGGRGNIKLYEVQGSKVIFYVDRLTASETCVEFRVSQETVVRNAKNGTIKAYDYYEPELFVSETFAFDGFNCAQLSRK